MYKAHKVIHSASSSLFRARLTRKWQRIKNKVSLEEEVINLKKHFGDKVVTIKALMEKVD